MDVWKVPEVAKGRACRRSRPIKEKRFQPTAAWAANVGICAGPLLQQTWSRMGKEAGGESATYTRTLQTPPPRGDAVYSQSGSMDVLSCMYVSPGLAAAARQVQVQVRQIFEARCWMEFMH